LSKHEDKLAGFLREVSNWRWDEFVKAEHSENYTSNEAIIFAMIRACVMQNMSAIKLAINRLDGKLVTPIRVEYPKIYYLFPNAGLAAGDVAPLKKIEAKEEEPPEVLTGEIIEASAAPEEDEQDLPSMGFRETLALMSDYSRVLPQQVIDRATQTQQWLLSQAEEPEGIPTVKTVVVAHLLAMASKRNVDAINEVFDAIDGKLVETIQVLGDDLYIVNYSTVAPSEAVPNADGVLQMEATAAQNIWAHKLGRDDK
jgi:hypothetical protein